MDAPRYTQDQQDRAREWVNERYPHASDEERSRLLDEALADIARIDAEADREEHDGPDRPDQR